MHAFFRVLVYPKFSLALEEIRSIIELSLHRHNKLEGIRFFLQEDFSKTSKNN
jgi:hypothetical protein